MPLRYRKKISASETVCDSTVLSVVKKTKVILLLYSLKSFFHPVFACASDYPQI